jgi:hypothetical protein
MRKVSHLAARGTFELQLLVAGVVGQAAVARGPLQHAHALGCTAALHVLPEPSHNLIPSVVATAQLLPSAHIHVVVADDHLGQIVRLQVAACGLGHMRSVSGGHDVVLCDCTCVCNFQDMNARVRW